MVKISDVDWDALDKKVTNTDYNLDELQPVPPELSKELRAAAWTTYQRLELEELRAKQAEIVVEVDSLQSRIDDLLAVAVA
jgi:hypothetical protein